MEFWKIRNTIINIRISNKFINTNTKYKFLKPSTNHSKSLTLKEEEERSIPTN
jgi:formylmethanofuran:tetrahydromethanopterin formyltransferase